MSRPPTPYRLNKATTLDMLDDAAVIKYTTPLGTLAIGHRFARGELFTLRNEVRNEFGRTAAELKTLVRSCDIELYVLDWFPSPSVRKRLPENVEAFRFQTTDGRPALAFRIGDVSDDLWDWIPVTNLPPSVLEGLPVNLDVDVVPLVPGALRRG